MNVINWQLRIGDKIIVLNGKDPLQFAFIDDPDEQLYAFDGNGNILATGELLNG